METFANIKTTLESLECSSLAILRESFEPSPGIADCISGSIQFFVVDGGMAASDLPMPVVCTIGVNYWQESARFDGILRPLSEPLSTVGNTGCVKSTALVIAAHNRNASTWATRAAVNPKSPLAVYAAENATARSGLSSGEPAELRDRFILIMTNVSPFVTQREWRVQAKITPDSCKEIVRDASHLDSLYESLGAKIDLWIGHSANDGTAWVWPEFARFVERHKIRSWLLAGNISPRAHLYFDHAYRKPQNPRFPWFAPERPALIDQ